MESLSAGRRAPLLPARPVLLVVDGEEVRCATLKRVLESGGYDVETAGAVRLALAAVVRARPAAVIIGALPPATPLATACRQLRAAALPTLPLPIVVLDPPPPQDADPHLADLHVLPVPFEMARLRELLGRLIAADTGDRGLPWVARMLAGASRLDEPPPADDVETRDVPPARLFDALEDGVALVDAGGRLVWTNAAGARLFHATPRQLAGRPLDDLLPDEGTAIAGAPTADTTWYAATGRALDGAPVSVDVAFRAVTVAADPRVLVTMRDAGPRRRTEHALRTNSDLREQLHRSQKIGALGRLAGGLAHDFNNLLQVIGGYAEALGGDLLDLPSRRRIVGQVQTAAERAASLTRQLLAFGRRQVLVPQILDLNVVVSALDQMLRRMLGEDVDLVMALAPDLLRVKVDAGQVEQVLLNLAINARDAMPQGGTLEITTANLSLVDEWTPPSLPATVPRGDWVMLTVRDTGTGMDAETAAQAFEPFFTTKDPTRGSGLGLSMVYGIVKQSGGYTWIDTAPGAGTSVHLLLPALVAPAETATAPASGCPTVAAPAVTGTIMLVEDDAEVRSLFAAFLRHAGHVVIEAADGREALDRFEVHHRTLDLIVTDVVMPHVSGPALARAARARRPDLRLIYISGYHEPAGVTIEPGEPTAVLSKPVTRRALLDQVAALLADPDRVT